MFFLQIAIVLTLWVMAYYCKSNYGLQPMGILNAIPATCCMWMGYMLRDERLKRLFISPFSIVAGFLIWLICYRYGSLSMAGLTYRLGVLQLVGAFYLTVILYEIFKRTDKTLPMFALIGKLSIAILCVHSVDYMMNVSTSIVLHLGLTDVFGVMLNMFLKLLFATMGVLIIKRTPVINRIFKTI